MTSDLMVRRKLYEYKDKVDGLFTCMLQDRLTEQEVIDKLDKAMDDLIASRYEGVIKKGGV